MTEPWKTFFWGLVPIFGLAAASILVAKLGGIRLSQYLDYFEGMFAGYVWGFMIEEADRGR